MYVYEGGCVNGDVFVCDGLLAVQLSVPVLVACDCDSEDQYCVGGQRMCCEWRL